MEFIRKTIFKGFFFFAFKFKQKQLRKTMGKKQIILNAIQKGQIIIIESFEYIKIK